MSNERKMGELWLTTLFSGKNVNVNLLLIVRHSERNLDDIRPLLLLCAILFDYAFSAETNQTLIATCHYLTSFRAISVLTDNKRCNNFSKISIHELVNKGLVQHQTSKGSWMVISNSAWIEYNDHLDIPIPNKIETEDCSAFSRGLEAGFLLVSLEDNEVICWLAKRWLASF